MGSDSLFDKLMVAVLFVGIVIIAVAGYGIATQPSVVAGDLDDTARIVDVTMTEFHFEPSSVTVEAGETIVFRAWNDGDVEHEFRVTDQASVDAHIAEGHADHGHGEDAGEFILQVPPGGSGTMTVTFDETSRFSLITCLVPGHYESGMFAQIDLQVDGVSVDVEDLPPPEDAGHEHGADDGDAPEHDEGEAEHSDATDEPAADEGAAHEHSEGEAEHSEDSGEHSEGEAEHTEDSGEHSEDSGDHSEDSGNTSEGEGAGGDEGAAEGEGDGHEHAPGEDH